MARRFARMSIRDDGTIDLAADVTTIGGLTRINFNDAVEWWAAAVG